VPVLVPPGYRRAKPADKPKLGPLLPVIDTILLADRMAPAKQQHSAKRIFERLRDEHDCGGGYPYLPKMDLKTTCAADYAVLAA
jgi:hypothetical protein